MIKGIENTCHAGRSDRGRLHRLLLVIGVVLSLPMLVAGSAWGAGDAKAPAGNANASKTTKAAPKALPLPEIQKVGSLAEQYCKSIRDAAVEARFAYQTAELKAIAKDVEERIEALEARTAELKDWIARREEFAK